METSVNHDQLKEILKEALVEVLEERRDLIQGLVEEALEDVALARAIEEGEGTDTVSRDEVFKLMKEQE
jgi:arginine deiminase